MGKQKEIVKLYKVHEDFRGNVSVVETSAEKQPTRYKLLSSEPAYGYRTFVYPHRVCLTREEAISKAIKDCEESIHHHYKLAREAELKFAKLKGLRG